MSSVTLGVAKSEQTRWFESSQTPPYQSTLGCGKINQRLQRILPKGSWLRQVCFDMVMYVLS